MEEINTTSHSSTYKQCHHPEETLIREQIATTPGENQWHTDIACTLRSAVKGCLYSAIRAPELPLKRLSVTDSVSRVRGRASSRRASLPSLSTSTRADKQRVHRTLRDEDEGQHLLAASGGAAVSMSHCFLKLIRG